MDFFFLISYHFYGFMFNAEKKKEKSIYLDLGEI